LHPVVKIWKYRFGITIYSIETRATGGKITSQLAAVLLLIQIRTMGKQRKVLLVLAIPGPECTTV
jgi:hypothetical protein